MFKIVGCIATAHDWRFVMLAAAICLLTVSITFYLYGRLPAGPSQLRKAWLGVTGLVAGSGIWAVHFVAMLAFQPGLRLGYEPVLTLGSLAVSVVFSVYAFAVAAPAANGSRRVAAGGALLGVGVAVMHFTGMSALRVQGAVVWDLAYVTVAVMVGVGFATAALLVGRPGGEGWRRFVAASLLGLGICGLHFTAMAAVQIMPDPRIAVPREIISRPILAGVVAALTCLVMLIAAAAVIIDLYLRQRTFTTLRQALDVMSDALVITDADDRLVIWNAGYAEHIGEAAVLLREGTHYAELLAHVVKTNFDLDDAARAKLIANRLAERRKAKPDVEALMSDGRWMRIRDQPTPSGGVVTISTDISNLKRSAEVLAQALSEADAASRAKTEFLANITHEIRTPLNGVLGMAQVIAQGELSSIQRKHLGVVQGSGEELLAILNSVLDVSRIESGKIELADGVIDAAKLAEHVAAAFAGAVRAKPAVKFSVTVRPGAIGPRRGDPARVSQILDVLVSNALKFTVAGEVGVSFAAIGCPDEGLRLTIADTGVGIAADILPRLFRKFTQADNSNTRSFGGAGLGLSIARPLAELMGGKITVESVLGKGSTFTVVLPARRIAGVIEAAIPESTAA